MITLEQFEARYILEITGRGERDNLPIGIVSLLGERVTLIQNALYKKTLGDDTSIEIDVDPFPLSKVVEAIGEDGVSASQFFTGPMLKMFDLKS